MHVQKTKGRRKILGRRGGEINEKRWLIVIVNDPGKWVKWIFLVGGGGKKSGENIIGGGERERWMESCGIVFELLLKSP